MKKRSRNKRNETRYKHVGLDSIVMEKPCNMQEVDEL